MPTAEEFDEFYLQTRRRLLLQAFALTGDLGAARSAVRDAYVAARHHWAKVGRLPEPEAWVRPRACAQAQRRHSARPWHREKGLTPEQASTLEALSSLPDIERKALLLTHLAPVQMDGIGRELGVTRQRAEQHLQSATSAMALALDIDSTGIRAVLQGLEPALAGTRLPRAPVIRRSGVRRRRVHAVVASGALALLTVVAGAFVSTASEPAPAATRPTEQRDLVPRSMLVPAATARAIAPRQAWRLMSTTDNTAGTGINSVCQTTRFADEQGLGTWVRTFRSSGEPSRRLTETVEISASPGAARDAYATTTGWYASCSTGRLQLLNSYAVSGVGDDARLLQLLLPGKEPHSYFVGIARTGALTVSTLVETKQGPAPRIATMRETLSDALQRLCGSEVAGTCVGSPQVRPELPPPSGKAPGMLAVADLPSVGRVQRRWVGTDPVPANGPDAATTCDLTKFRREGARQPRTRTFLVPRAKVPKRFGITQTVGRFGTPARARALVERVEAKLAACPDKHLGTDVTLTHVVPDGAHHSRYALWRLDNQIDKKEHTVSFWMGIAQVGPWVSQVTFTPAPGADMNAQAFSALVTRARDRLLELTGP